MAVKLRLHNLEEFRLRSFDEFQARMMGSLAKLSAPARRRTLVKIYELAVNKRRMDLSKSSALEQAI